MRGRGLDSCVWMGNKEEGGFLFGCIFRLGGAIVCVMYVGFFEY